MHRSAWFVLCSLLAMMVSAFYILLSKTTKNGSLFYGRGVKYLTKNTRTFYYNSALNINLYLLLFCNYFIKTNFCYVKWKLSLNYILHKTILSATYLCNSSPENTEFGITVDSMLAHRLRRWSNIESTLVQRFMFSGNVCNCLLLLLLLF